MNIIINNFFSLISYYPIIVTWIKYEKYCPILKNHKKIFQINFDDDDDDDDEAVSWCNLIPHISWILKISLISHYNKAKKIKLEQHLFSISYFLICLLHLRTTKHWWHNFFFFFSWAVSMQFVSSRVLSRVIIFQFYLFLFSWAVSMQFVSSRVF